MIKIAVAGTRGFPGIQGGVETHCEKLYPSLVNHGCDITVFTRKPYVRSRRERYKGVKLIPLDCPHNKFLEAVVHTFKSVLKSRTLKPDILHIHAVGPSLFTPLARALGMKVVVTNHGPDYKRQKWSFPAKMFLRFCERMGMMYANEVIAISPSISENIRKKYGKNATVIPNGVEIFDTADTDALEKFRLQRHKYILAVGRFVREKGFDDLIDAYNLGNSGEWKLVIVGDSDHEDEYGRSLKAKSLKNSNIVLTGFLSGQPLRELYSHAGLFVLPSYHEGLPIVLLEAMSYGLLCIASDIPANKNVGLNEECFFKTGDVSMLSRKIDEFIYKPWGETDKRRQINIMEKNFSWPGIAVETMKVYEHVLK